ncbi:TETRATRICOPEPTIDE REPEAT (TPR)-LIKE SUPERFAMILY PROTEIN [Salix viminalis]|nr:TETRATRICOPEPTIDE REPEAT (TPR)-LIKE SUPERFAMILY PROTEIN [Salix viminalis]
MASKCDIPQASLVHKEEPYALIILKSCRETHCHYCMNQLQADTVPCTSCTIPLYCSEHCQIQAGGKPFSNFQDKIGTKESHSKPVDLCSDSNPVECFPEHKHECLGVNWPAILPTDIVLAGRILVKSTTQRCSTESNALCDLGLSHSYTQIGPESKLELHIYAIVLLCCLHRSFRLELPIIGVSLSQTIILISQIRVNSMAIVQMKSVDDPPDQFRKLASNGDALTSSLEQVPVGQAIYKAASLFNHSCLPNIHAYFLSRTLFIRTTEYVSTGCPLELSYGPQVGQLDCKDRLRYLADKYSFQCQCRGCSQLNLSDLALNAFCCVNHNCAGVVLESTIINGETHKLNNFPRAPEKQKFDSQLQGHKLNIVDINNMASLVLKFNNSTLQIHPGFCLHCGSHRDLDTSREAINKAWSYIKRLQEAIISKYISGTTLLDASRALGILRSTLHAYNKSVAEAEDNLAQAFCLVRDFHSAREHCQESIKILQTLYDPDHIVIGYEMVKLASIQLSLDDPAAVDSINHLGVIFARYFGPHVDFIAPYQQFLKRVAHR